MRREALCVGQAVRIFCPPLRGHAPKAEKELYDSRIPTHGTVVFAGPRFAAVALRARETGEFLYNESFWWEEIVPADGTRTGGDGLDV